MLCAIEKLRLLDKYKCAVNNYYDHTRISDRYIACNILEFTKYLFIYCKKARMNMPVFNCAFSKCRTCRRLSQLFKASFSQLVCAKKNCFNDRRFCVDKDGSYSVTAAAWSWHILRTCASRISSALSKPETDGSPINIMTGDRFLLYPVMNGPTLILVTESVS